MFNVDCVACDETAQGDFEMAEPARIQAGSLQGGKAELAYLVPWGTAASGRLLAAALREELRVFSTDKEFTLSGKEYPRGTLIIKVVDNPSDLQQRLERLAAETGADIYATDSGWVEAGVNFGSGNVLHVRRPRVALAWDRPTSSNAAGATRYVLERQFGYPVTVIRARQLAGADMSLFDVLILPEGDYASVLNANATEQLKRWVSSGGTLIGIGRALEYLTDSEVGLLEATREDKASDSEAGTEEKGDKEDKEDNSGKILTSEEDYLKAIQPKSESPDSVPGALARAELDPDHWMTAGLGTTVNALFRGRNIYSPIASDKGVNAARFSGPDELLASGHLWEESHKQLAYKPLVMVQEHGRGLVVAFTADPNFRAYMDGLNILFLNAVFRGPARARPAVAP
jgi:hypothetical protein